MGPHGAPPQAKLKAPHTSSTWNHTSNNTIKHKSKETADRKHKSSDHRDFHRHHSKDFAKRHAWVSVVVLGRAFDKITYIQVIGHNLLFGWVSWYKSRQYKFVWIMGVFWFWPCNGFLLWCGSEPLLSAFSIECCFMCVKDLCFYYTTDNTKYHNVMLDLVRWHFHLQNLRNTIFKISSE